MSAGRVAGGWTAALLVGTAMVALAHAAPAAAQTAHHRFEAFPGGAVSEIYLDETALGAQNMLEVLRWYVPNVVVTENAVQVRGGCPRWYGTERVKEPPNPLLIVDGYAVSNRSVMSSLLGLNPFQVEKVTVLRDVASTSMYGSRAACGVILVTTLR